MKYLPLAFLGMILFSHPTLSATNENPPEEGSPPRHVRRGSFSMQRPLKKEGATQADIASQAADALQAQLKLYSAPVATPQQEPLTPTDPDESLTSSTPLALKNPVAAKKPARTPPKCGSSRPSQASLGDLNEEEADPAK